MWRSARSRAVADLPIGARGGPRHHSATGKRSDASFAALSTWPAAFRWPWFDHLLTHEIPDRNDPAIPRQRRGRQRGAILTIIYGSEGKHHVVARERMLRLPRIIRL